MIKLRMNKGRKPYSGQLNRLNGSNIQASQSCQRIGILGRSLAGEHWQSASSSQAFFGKHNVTTLHAVLSRGQQLGTSILIQSI
eukprot:1156178-Pelagomonas_calceolata.AAC.4